MGIINLTPDSFYPNSRFSFNNCMPTIEEMLEEGADIIDLGAESTRPGAKTVPAEYQISQLIPAIKQIRNISDIAISVDTSEPIVMQTCIESGANMINDIRALSYNGALKVAADYAVEVCLTHMQGNPSNMQDKPHYPKGIIPTLEHWFAEKTEMCLEAGIKQANIILDPGFGFGKTNAHNWSIIEGLEQLTKKYEVAIGVSNKSTFSEVIGCEQVENRRLASVVTEAFAFAKNVSIIRSHNIRLTKQAIDTAEKIITGGK